MFRANQWRGGYVEGHGYKDMFYIPDIVIYGDYYIGSGDNPFDDDDWDDDGINPHPNPSPDETGGNGGNYPPGGGGGGGGNGTGGGNGNNGGGNTSDSLPVPKHTPIEKLGAAFAGVSYHDTNEGIYKYYVESRGWSNTSLDILLGLLLHSSYSGLKFSIWEKKENDRIVAYVCSYAGTDTNLMDLKGIIMDGMTDVGNLLGMLTGQYAQAAALAIALDQYCTLQGIALTFVGHSLGGGLAALSSLVTGRPAITYNPAAVMALLTEVLEKTGISVDDSNIYKYIMEGDYVTEWQDALGFSAWGRHISVHNSTPQMDAHSIYTMYKNLK